MSSLPSIDLDALVSRLVQLLRTPSPTGDTEDALALVVRWLREVGLAPRVTRKGAVTVTLPGAPTPRRAPSRDTWTRWAPS